MNKHSSYYYLYPKLELDKRKKVKKVIISLNHKV